VAYKAEIAVNVRGLKDVKTLETSLNKISGKISAINKVSAGNSKAVRVEKQVLNSKAAQADMMSKTRRIGDLVQKQADKGLKVGLAQEAISKSALLNSKKEFTESKRLQKVALDELKIQKAISKEIGQQAAVKSSVKRSGPASSLTSLGGGTPLGLSGVQAFPQTKDLGMFGPKLPFTGQKTGFGSSPILGSKDLPGSPKSIMEVARQNAVPVKGFKNLPGSPAFHEEQAKQLRRLNRRTKSLKVPLGPEPRRQIGPIMAGQGFDPTGASSALNFSKSGRLLQGPAGSSKNTFGNLRRRFGPSRGFDAQSALISGGFPLLFGQGPGVAAAGALGGGIGGMFGQMGGFAGGIAATAAVQSIQNVINGIGELGQAMNRLNPNISAMSQAMGIAGTVEEKRLQLIEKNLGKQAAFNAALEMLGEKIGADQAEELRKFGETFQRLGNEVTLFFTKVQAAIAKLLNQVLDARADANVRGRARDLVAQNPNNRAFSDVNQRIEQIQARETTGRAGAKQKQDDLRAAKAERLEIAETLILEKDRDKARAQTNKLITAGLADLQKENGLNRAIIAGNEEEFRIKQAVKDKVDEMGLSMKDLNDTQKQRIRDDVITNKNLKEQARIQKEINDSFKNMASTIQSDIKDGIKGLIKGTSTLGDLVNNVADRFLDMALNQALFGNVGGKDVTGGLFKFLGFARGGRPPVGKPSIVGEKGPELFVPRSSGTIVPNNKLGGGGSTNVVVNVDASGTDVQGDEAQAKELGTLISSAVQGELLKQQRPGGLLASLR